MLRDHIAPLLLPLVLLGGSSAFGCINEALEVPCPNVAAGDLVITEIHGPQSGEDRYGEWIEIFNASTESVNLKGLSVRVLRLDGSAQSRLLVRDSVSMSAGSYAVLGKQVSGAEPDHVDYGYISDIDNKLYDSGAIQIESCGSEIDLVVYRNLPSKGSLVLDGSIVPPTAVANDEEANWCIDDEADEMSPLMGIRGTPQEENFICPS